MLLTPAAPSVAPPTTPLVDTPEGEAEGRYSGIYNLPGAPAITAVRLESGRFADRPAARRGAGCGRRAARGCPLRRGPRRRGQHRPARRPRRISRSVGTRLSRLPGRNSDLVRERLDLRRQESTAGRARPCGPPRPPARPVGCPGDAVGVYEAMYRAADPGTGWGTGCTGRCWPVWASPTVASDRDGTVGLCAVLDAKEILRADRVILTSRHAYRSVCESGIGWSGTG